MGNDVLRGSLSLLTLRITMARHQVLLEPDKLHLMPFPLLGLTWFSHHPMTVLLSLSCTPVIDS